MALPCVEGELCQIQEHTPVAIGCVAAVSVPISVQERDIFEYFTLECLVFRSFQNHTPVILVIGEKTT